MSSGTKALLQLIFIAVLLTAAFAGMFYMAALGYRTWLWLALILVGSQIPIPRIRYW